MSMEAGKAWESRDGALRRRTDGMGITKKRPCIHMGVHILEPATGFAPLYQLSYTGIDMKYCNKWSGGLSNEFYYFRESCVLSKNHAERMRL